MSATEKEYDAFVSYSHDDAEWVELLAGRLEDECGFRIWLDKWVLVPGQSWQQEMARGLEEASSCAVCIGSSTPEGWFREEIERALNLQNQDIEFRVIPVLLPETDPNLVPAFLSLRSWADFRQGQNPEYAIHVLKQGILGQPVGRWAPEQDANNSDTLSKHERKIIELQRFRSHGLNEKTVIEFERKILERWLDE